MKQIWKEQLLAIGAAYMAGSYAYSIEFMLRKPVIHFDAFQIGLLAISPVWFALHMSLLLLCTLGGLHHGRWNEDNTASFIAFGGVFLIVYFLVRAFQRRRRQQPNHSV